MCGLAGMLFTPGERSTADWNAVRKAFTANFLANEKRGRDASGIALVRDDGSYLLHKDEVPASMLVQDAHYHAILDQLDEHTTVLLGHTRLPTKGTTHNDLNNHPIVTNDIIGVHNGTIKNDDFIFEHFNFLRHGQVDSEVIFTLLDCLDPHLLNGSYLQHMANVMGVLQGPMAVLAVDLRCPSRLLVVKDGSPLAYHHESDWNAVLFSSRYLWLRKTFGPQVTKEVLSAASVVAFRADNLSHYEQRLFERIPPAPPLSYLRERRW